MDTTVEVDATMVRLRQRPRRSKKIIIYSLAVCLLIICCVVAAIIYKYEKNKSNLKKAPSDSTSSKKSIHSVGNRTHNKHRVHDAQKHGSEMCSNATWYTRGKTIIDENDRRSVMNQLVHPSDLVVDDQNAIYIADSLNHRIIKWDEGALEGRIVAGGNGMGNQTNQLNDPTAVFVDKKKNIYVADNGNNRIQRWLPNATDGEIIIGKFGRGSQLTQIDDCRDIYVDSQENVYIAEQSNNRIAKWSPGATFGQIVVNTDAPINVYVHEETGDIYVLSYAANVTKHFTANGSLVGHIGDDLIKGFYDAINFANASSKSFNVFMVNSRHYRTLRKRIGNNRNMKITVGNSSLLGDEENEYNQRVKVQFDTRGNLLALDLHNHRVQNFSKDNIICDTNYSPLKPLPYRPSSPYNRVQPSDLTKSLKNQKTSEDVSSSKNQDSPKSDDFHPQPLFQKSGKSVNDNSNSDGLFLKINPNDIDQLIHSYSGDVRQHVNSYSDGMHQSLDSYSNNVREPLNSYGHVRSSSGSRRGKD